MARAISAPKIHARPSKVLGLFRLQPGLAVLVSSVWSFIYCYCPQLRERVGRRRERKEEDWEGLESPFSQPVPGFSNDSLSWEAEQGVAVSPRLG